MKHKLLSTVAGVAGLVALFLATSSPALAASFNANNLISDGVFNNTNTMSAAQIDSFLNGFGSTSCISTAHGFSAPDPTGYSPSSGFTYGGNVTAGQVIYDAGAAYGLNPQVILATLQKEQSLVTGGAGCSTLQYTGAAGYGCPDGGTTYNYSGVNLYSINGQQVSSVNGTCVNSSAKAGFSQQVIHAAWLLKFGQQRSEGNIGWNAQHANFPESGDVWNNSDDPQTCYGGPMTQGTFHRCPNDSAVFYDGYTTIDGQSTHMDDGATATLYWYTPHFNGNQHFDTIFTNWFGSLSTDYTVGVLCNPQNDGSCTVPNGAAQYIIYNDTKYPIPDTVTETAWNLANVATPVSANYLNGLPTGTSLSRDFLINGGGPTQYFVDAGNSYAITSLQMLSSWNLQTVTAITVPSDLASTLNYKGNLSYVVQEPNSQTQALVDGTDNSGDLLFRPFTSPNIETAWESDSPTVIPISQDFVTQFSVDLSNSPISSTQINCSGTDYQVISDQKLTEPSGIAALFPGPLLTVSQQTCNRLIFNSTTLTPFIRAYNQPTVYMIDNGEKNAVSNPQILQAWGGQNGVNIVSDGYINAIPSNSTVSGYLANVSSQYYLINNGQYLTIPSGLSSAYTTSGNIFNASSTLINWLYNGGAATNFIRGASTPTVYLIDNGTLEPIPSWQVFTLWDGSRNEAQTVVTNDVLSQFIEGGSWVSPYFTTGGTNYLIDNGAYHSVSPTVAAAWGLSNPYQLTSSILSRFTSGSALTTAVSANGTTYNITNGRSYGTTNSTMLADWSINSPLAVSTNLVGYIPSGGALTQFARSSNASDLRIFLVDGSNLYALQNPPQALSYGIGTQNAVVIPASNISNYTITNAKQLVTDSTNYYVVDASNIRPFANGTVKSDFAPDGASDFLQVSDNFLNLYSTGSSVGQAIKGTPPSVYAMVNGQERYLNGQQFAGSFNSTYTQVSDWLIANLPQGSNYQ